ncbi:RNA polymerase sigma-70 factor, ECF subfamily [Mariniphaga anaerophila]|uniref:RNA polymerase sigma-70 factor, ECF subfamily n=1 Tax=Mariniphaga anaerophila TaxID=1484053 RepID=A0A1M5CGW7_9BACT|nr:RNA polymerase sigma factor [Mariniphaga anaerophila]SHF53946.1 RNA polymerase sigma-70 factor, ECF subfamily [Mariniphaga anaerophila]
MTETEFKNSILPYSRKLYPMLKRILKDEEETRDALQDLMARFWSKRMELKKCRNQQAYVITIAKNYSFDLLKRKRNISFSENGEKQFFYVKAEEINPDLKEKFEQVHKVIERLPEKYREVIRLRDIDGFSYHEIKEMTGMEVPNIRVVLSRARKKVKEEVEKIYDYEHKKQFAGKIL